MKKIFVFILILVYAINGRAQDTDSIAVWMARHDYRQALQLVEAVPGYDTLAQMLYIKGIALKNLDRQQEALPWLERAYAADTTDLTCMIELVNTYNNLSLYRKSQELLLITLQSHPNNRDLDRQLANSYFLGENYQQAKKNYIACLQQDTTYYLLRQLTLCYDKLGIRDSAIQLYTKILELQPDDPNSVFRLATLYKDNKGYLACLELTEAYLARDTTHVNINMLNGYIYYIANDFEMAASRLLRCRMLGDSSFFVNKYLGYALYQQEDYRKAIPVLEFAFRQNMQDAELLYVLGMSHDHLGHREDAIFYLNNSINLISPNVVFLSRVHQDLADSYTQNYQYPEALGSFLKASELNPADTMLIYRIGGFYDHWMHDKEQALVYYRKFMETGNSGQATSDIEFSSQGMVVPLYNVVQRRIEELEKELSAQKMLTPEMIRQDIDTLLRVLTNIHPTFYLSDNRNSLIGIRDTIQSNLSVHGLFQLLQPLVAVDGHTTLQFNGRIYPEMEKPLLPFEVVVYNDSLYVKKNLSGDPLIRQGMKILRINGMETGEIIAALLDYIPGERTAYKLTSLNGSGFSNYYQLVFGNFPRFELHVEYNNSRIRITTGGISREDFSASNTVQLDFKILNDSTGYLKIGRFTFPPQFMHFTDSVFTLIQESNLNHLIIDKTHGGGFSDLADSLLGYFTQIPYRQFEKKSTRISSETGEYISEIANSGKVNGDFFELTPALKQPDQRDNRFNGQVYILTGPTAYSAATLFVAMANCYSDAIIVGQETGQPLISNGDLSRHALQNSGLPVYTSHATYYFPCYHNEEEGVKPDVEVIPTLEDLLLDRNVYLEEALKLIGK